MKRIAFSLAMVIAVALALTTTIAHAAKYGKSKWPIKIEYVSFVDRNHMLIKIYKENLEAIEKNSNGKLKFDYRGGPEAMNIFAQAPATIKGATDMVFTSPSFMSKIIKGADMLTLDEIPVSQHRKSGLYDYMNEIFNPVGLQFIQMYPREPGTSFYVLSKKPITKLDDFKGLSARGADWFDGVGPALGFSTVALRFHEEYTAMERGIIDFGRMTLDSMAKFRLFEVGKYLLDVPWATAPASWFMNIDKWNEIPADMQQLILDTLYDRADDMQAKTVAEVSRYREILLKNGVETTNLSTEDEKKFREVVEKAMYDYFSKGSPEISTKIYELTHKK